MSRRREYRRLPGRCRSWFRVSTTWIGADHLLLVDRHLFVETYRRVYFHDIQAIVTHPTPRSLFWFAVLLLWSLIMVALTLNAGGGWRTFWAVPTAAVVAAFAVHLVRGPTWACHVRTPLQTIELSAQRRRRWVARSLRRLQPLLDAAQGSLSREAILSILDGERGPGPGSEARLGPEPRSRPVPAPGAPIAPPPIGRRETGLVPGILVLGLFAEAAVSALQINFHDPMLSVAAIALFLAQIGLAIAVATRRRGGGSERMLRVFGWTTLWFLTVMFVVGGAVNFVRAIAAGLRSAAEGTAAPFEAYNLATPPSWVVIPWIAGTVGLAVWGAFLLRRLRTENESLWLNLKDWPDDAV